MGMRRIWRNATPEKLAAYERELPRIKDPGRFTVVLRRKRAIEACLKHMEGANGKR